MKTPAELIKVIYDLIDFVAGPPPSAREAVWARVTEMATEAVEAEAATWYDLAPEGDRLLPNKVLGFAAEKVTKTAVPIGTGICGWVAERREAAVVADAYGDERFLKQVDSLTGFRTKSVLAVPLFEGCRFLGVHGHINNHTDNLTTQHLMFVTDA
jgi:GAF domain-containing protein